MFKTKTGIALTIASCMIASFAFGNSAFAQVPDGQNPHHYPPMLGDTAPFVYGGGLGINAKTYDVTGTVVSAKQVFEIGKQATVVLNITDVRQANEIKRVILFIAPSSVTSPESAMPYILWDSSTGVDRNIGKSGLSGMTGGLSITDTNHAEAKFSFVPLKSMGQVNLIVRMWDIRGVSQDHIISGITIGSASGSTGNSNPCSTIVMTKGWKMTSDCLTYLLQ